MKHYKSLSFGILFFAIFGLFSCTKESTNSVEKSPYFDLKGFIAEKIQEVDGAEVNKQSEIQGESKQVEDIYSVNDWKEEFKVFSEADINNNALLQSYQTTSTNNTLTHELLPDSKGKVKYIKVTYTDDEVSSVSIKIAENSMFYSTTTLAELYLDNTTHLIDHYSIETTQKIWFLDPNNIVIQGALIP